MLETDKAHRDPCELRLLTTQDPTTRIRRQSPR